MKIIKASKMSEMAAKIAEAKRELAQYDEEKVAYVRECQDEIMQAISDSYQEDEYGDLYQEPVGSKLSEIKRDYLLGAIEDDMMTEEEFEAIFDALDILDLELAHAQASTDVSDKKAVTASTSIEDELKVKIFDHYLDKNIPIEGYPLGAIFDAFLDSPYEFEGVANVADQEGCSLLQAIDLLNSAYDAQGGV